jgi:hypothetical protein
MGQAQTTLRVTNATQLDADVTFDVPGSGLKREHRKKGWTDHAELHLAPSASGQCRVARARTGSVTATGVVSFSNGSVVHFSFGVEAEDASDTIVLTPTNVIYNGKPRRWLLRNQPRPKSLRKLRT